MNKTILVTGGAGYIGSHFCKIAKKNGYNPISYDNLSTGNRELVKWGDLVVGDIGDYDKLMETFKKYNPIAVFHFAASIKVNESVINPVKYYENNIAKPITLLKALVDSKIKYVIFSSSAAVFGKSDYKIIGEDVPTKPISPYAKTKLMFEQMLEDFDVAYGLKFTSLRYFNASGSDPDLETGRILDEPATHLMGAILEKYKNKETVKVFGGDWETRDGTCIRDYIHVNDLASAHILALEKMVETNDSKIINLGTGCGYSVLEIIKSTEIILSDKVRYEIADRRAGDFNCSICDNSFAKNYLGWEPEYKNVEDHLRHSWNWMNKNNK